MVNDSHQGVPKALIAIEAHRSPFAGELRPPGRSQLGSHLVFTKRETKYATSRGIRERSCRASRGPKVHRLADFRCEQPRRYCRVGKLLETAAQLVRKCVCARWFAGPVEGADCTCTWTQGSTNHNFQASGLQHCAPWVRWTRIRSNPPRTPCNATVEMSMCPTTTTEHPINTTHKSEHVSIHE